MPDAINVREGFIAALYDSNFALANAVSYCMRYVKELDPQAGYGSAHPFALACDLALSAKQTQLLLLEANNPIKLYVFLRATSFVHILDPSGLDEILAQPIDFLDLAYRIQLVCNDFNVAMVSRSV